MNKTIQPQIPTKIPGEAPDSIEDQGTHTPTTSTLTMRHILLVEDDHALREVFLHALEAEGYAVTEFSDGTKARAYFEACLGQEQPRRAVDCIVTDLRMPGFDGLEVLELLQEYGHQVPTVLVTAYADVRTLQRAMDLGVKALLDKPVRTKDLLQAVRRQLEESPTS